MPMPVLGGLLPLSGRTPFGGAYSFARIRCRSPSSSAPCSNIASAADSMTLSGHAWMSTPWRARLPSHASQEAEMLARRRRTT
jgi:hypothetical protein